MLSFFGLFRPKNQEAESSGQEIREVKESEQEPAPEQKAEAVSEQKESSGYMHEWINPEDYDARECFWDGSKEDDVDIHSEAVIYDWITESLSDQYYCFPHISLREIFRMKNDADKYYLRFLAPFHVDFLFVNKKSGACAVAVELDGKYHETEKKQKDADDFKNRLFAKNKIPLIRIKKNEKEAYTVFEEIMEALESTNLYNRRDYPNPAKCNECGKKMYARKRKDGKGSFLYCNNCKNDNGKSLTFNWDAFPESRMPDILISKK